MSHNHWTNVAANTQLPPSPELKSTTAGVIPNIHALYPPTLAPLDGTGAATDNAGVAQLSRLRSIAKYDSFRPQALACSPPVASSQYSDAAGGGGSDDDHHHSSLPSHASVPLSPRGGKKRRHPHHHDHHSAPRSAVSLGAVAGFHGVALFRVTRPHAPLLILSHASGMSSDKRGGAGGTTKDITTGIVSSLSFQPDASQTLYLAAARGSGVLVWDVSGHSLQPLWGRLGVDRSSSTSVDSDSITSLAWMPDGSSSDSNNNSSSGPWLAATTASTACLWDLREPARTTLFKPSLRFGASSLRRPSNNGGASASPVAPYVQVACSGLECAVLNKKGTLSVFDIRMTDRRSNNTTDGAGSLYSVSSFRHAGIGLAYLSTSAATSAGRGSSWVSWGLDSPDANAIVRIWTGSSSDASVASADNDCVNTQASLDDSEAIINTTGCRLLGECTTPNLACARVCPAPMKDAFVTIGVDQAQQGSSSNNCNTDLTSWHADLWKLQSDQTDNVGLEKVLTFKGGAEADKSQTCALGNDFRYGSLCASELALTSQVTVPAAGSPLSRAEQCLLLCSLTDSGYITTHAIPEAVSQAGDWNVSPLNGALAAAHTGAVFPPEKAPVTDAARAWGKPREPEMTSSAESRRAKDNKEIAGPSVVAGGAPMPFDMDVPVAYSMAGVSEVPIGVVSGISSIPAVSSDDENDQTKDDARDAALLMERIETDRIPCPRLCGAVFGPGVGALVVFNNGAVSTMWKWFENSDPARLASVPGLVCEPSKAGRGVLDEEKAHLLTAPANRNCPRTLQDLVDMTSAANEAQWGDQDDSDESSSGFDLGANFFEEGSEGSSSGEDFEEPAESPGDTNLGDAHRPSEPTSRDVEKKSSEQNPGPSSDMLAPFVSVTHQFDQLSLNNQSVQLAKGFSLGRLVSNSQDCFDNVTPGHVASDRVQASGSCSSLKANLDSAPGSEIGFPHHSLLAPNLPQPQQHFPRASSDPLTLASKSSPSTTRVSMQAEEERGVHGGEYSVRPNVQESMVFLKKLFTHQQQEGGLSSLFSPPDGPMLPTRFSDPPVSPVIAAETTPRHEKKSSAASHGARIGVYTLRASDPDVNNKRSRNLAEIEATCLRNAEVCESLGETGKQQTWELLAKAVESGFSNMRTACDGWGGGGGALSVNLVRNLLCYYESLGDVQMLSTMVCVLRSTSHQEVVNASTVKPWGLLPKEQDYKYDSYIRRYSDLLYGWGLLTTRAELCKHMVRVPTHIEGGADGSQDCQDESRTGIAFSFRCPLCSQETMPGTNFCRSCQDYAFRCIICDTAVRGLFTACDSCGHGGHVGHLKEWFSSHDKCPTGCGCTCTLTGTNAANPPGDLSAKPREMNAGAVMSAGQTSSGEVFIGQPGDR